MSPSHAQLTVASDEEMPDLVTPKPLTSRWRGLGLAVTIVGLVCMVGANWPSTKQVPTRQRFGQMRDTIVQAFQERVLEDQSTSSLVTSLEFEFGEADGEEPSAMEISAKIHQDETPSEHFVLENTFIAEEGQGEALKTAIDAVFEMLLQMQPDDEQAKIREMVTVTQDGDEVRVAIADIEGRMEGNGTDGEQGRLQKLQEALDANTEGKKPEFTASLKFGRDLDSLHENMQDNAFVAWHGLHFRLDAEFKGLVVEMIEASLVGLMPPKSSGDSTRVEEMDEAAQWGRGFATLGGKMELRYKHEDELGDLFAKVPTIAFLFDSLTQCAQNMPAPIRKLLLDFKGVIDGNKKTEIRGLPDGYKITMDYHNFKPSKLIVKVIDAVQPGDGEETVDGGEDEVAEENEIPVEENEIPPEA